MIGLIESASISDLGCTLYSDCSVHNAYCALNRTETDGTNIFLCKCLETSGYYETENENSITLNGIEYTTKCGHISGNILREH